MQNSGRERQIEQQSTAENPYGVFFTPVGAAEINGLILRELQEAPEVRRGVVRILKWAIDENMYLVCEESVAESMINHCPAFRLS
ncbi:MAG: hypothetical protein JW854_12660 [Actinobacteria bacterium]|nr:hypothetical protein [Actinomycetota bacterium]